MAILTNSNHQHNGMEGTKFLPSQTKSIYHYKSIRFIYVSSYRPDDGHVIV